MIRCKTSLSINGQAPVECLPITPDCPMGLCEEGTARVDSADALLKIDAHNELVIVKVSEAAVMLERAGRKLQLRTGKEIRVCEKDVIWLGDTSISIAKSTFLISQSPVLSRSAARAPLREPFLYVISLRTQS